MVNGCIVHHDVVKVQFNSLVMLIGISIVMIIQRLFLGVLFCPTGKIIHIYGLNIDSTFISDDGFGEVTSKQEEFSQKQETSMSFLSISIRFTCNNLSSSIASILFMLPSKGQHCRKKQNIVSQQAPNMCSKPAIKLNSISENTKYCVYNL
jgi:hypothetical protein